MPEPGRDSVAGVLPVKEHSEHVFIDAEIDTLATTGILNGAISFGWPCPRQLGHPWRCGSARMSSPLAGPVSSVAGFCEVVQCA